MEPLFPPAPRPYSPYAPIPTLRHRPRAGQATRPRRGPAPDERPVSAAEREAEIARIARQLARVVRDVPWGRVQNDAWDRLCPFIFRLRSVETVRTRAGEIARERGIADSEFVHYALRRWYCFWGARLAELLFLRHPRVEPGPPRDHEVDFLIDGVPFDLKTSDRPRVFTVEPSSLLARSAELARWLYAHQSRERRYHTANRLFLILDDPTTPEETWRLRSDVAALRTSIDRFLADPSYQEIEVVDQTGQRRRVLTAIIPVQPLPGPRQLRLELVAGTAGQPIALPPPPTDRQLRLPLAK